jgi:cystathionine beta-lyase/cystathionine gamma-synthase
MAAIHAALVSLVQAGDRVVSTRAVYGSTRSQLANVLRRLGVTTEFVDVTDHAAVEAALTVAPTRVLYAETISNPTIVVADHRALSAIARRHGAAYVVDNTFASPYLCRPIELGADLVIESATKFLGGHSDVLAGVVSGGREAIRRVRDVQVDTGGTLAPVSAFLVLRGISTLALRMERHATTAAALAAWLERQEGVLRVYHPSLASHPQHAVAARQLAIGGGMLAFELAGGRAAGRAFIDGLSITELTASLGSVHTMVVHPPSTTHRQLDDAALVEAGIAPGLLRVSVGLEDLDDLVADFERALGAARTAAARETAAPSGEAAAAAVRRA